MGGAVSREQGAGSMNQKGRVGGWARGRKTSPRPPSKGEEEAPVRLLKRRQPAHSCLELISKGEVQEIIEIIGFGIW